MKSYFAKLAARATLANAPEPSSVTTSRTQDPFESATDVDAASSRPFAQPTNTSDSFQTSRSQPLTRSVDNSRSRSVETSFERTQSSEEQRDRSSATSVVPNVQPAPQPSLELTPVAQETVSHRESRELIVESDQAASRLVKKESDISSLAPTTSREIREAKPASEADAEEKLAELKQDQSVLLRKADAFMSQLFERRSSVKPRELDDDEEEEERSSKPALREEVTRLQPTPKTAPLIEVADEQPSLVIGKLTVEVTPPPAPAVTPPRQVVVVRGRGAGRQGGVQSSQRFGLGQF
jgi:hypothetical protein